MKNLLFLALCGLFLTACGGAKETPLAHPLPTEGPMYGITKQGVFFIHDALVQNAGVKTVKLASQATEWKRRTMEKKGDYHIFDCNQINHDFALFVFYKNFKIQYCFYVDKHVSIPGAFAQNKEVLKSLDSEDLSESAIIGPVFFTKALDEDLHLW